MTKKVDKLISLGDLYKFCKKHSLPETTLLKIYPCLLEHYYMEGAEEMFNVEHPGIVESLTVENGVLILSDAVL